MDSRWHKDLQTALIKKFGAQRGNALQKKYGPAFSASYREDFSAAQAINDILKIETLSENHRLEISLHTGYSSHDDFYNVRLFQYGTMTPLSDLLPMLENFGLKTFEERPYKVKLQEGILIWISDFRVTYFSNPHLNLLKMKDIFEDAFRHVYFNLSENDGFNKLALGASLTWQDIIILRTYAKYLQQTGFHFSQHYIENALVMHPEIAKNIVTLFKIRFDPAAKSSSNKKALTVSKSIQECLEKINSLDEDRILRSLWQLVSATLRTNYFQKTAQGTMKEYFSIKLASSEIPDLPLPRPLCEVFVYSTRFEAIHLRSAKVARGGIRWSDRHEDFRTEILGLMKAQKVKNAIIVPSGAKGGFVLKSHLLNATREALQAEVIHCYKSFMRGLLDITDNLKNGSVVRPKDVVCYDGEDTYLVVAADKGTATFSDIANSISKEYDFWLGDAFASGGRTGYDHKKIGITARGAWESIKRHFRELNINYNKTEFTVVGIGDMSGDVFGNGMLYTDRIKLVAAFDHRHIFIDPAPHPKKSFAERKRLFNLPNSSWDDYNKTLISSGGGVFKRTEKSIKITPEMQAILQIDDTALTPNELIRAILKAPVFLLYNGGIGTYVKASTESLTDASDKTNDFVRVNGNELRCRMVGEGGNLGFTQLGRIEYALQGGLINADFIDNSGGVDCSDHEVNIKIILDQQIRKGALTEKKRDVILAELTNEVAELVLTDNYNQALVMSFSADHSKKLAGLYHIYLKELEQSGVLDRIVEFLPDDKKLVERKSSGMGLARPEIAILLAYTKIFVKHEILKSDVPEDSFLSNVICDAFPKTLCKTLKSTLLTHPLRREIIATQLSNKVVNEMGITFIYRMHTETGEPIGNIIRAFMVVSTIFKVPELQKLIDSLEWKISTQTQYELLHYVRTLINLASRWFLRGKRMEGDIEKIVAHYTSGVDHLQHLVPKLMVGATKDYLESLKQHFIQEGIDESSAHRIAITRGLYTALNIIEVATQHKLPLNQTAIVYFDVGARFNLVWFRDQIAADSREGHWNTLARLTLRDELDTLQKSLTIVIIASRKNIKQEKNLHRLIDSWSKQNAAAITRWEKVLELLHSSSNVDYSMFFIVIRELCNQINAQYSDLF